MPVKVAGKLLAGKRQTDTHSGRQANKHTEQRILYTLQNLPGFLLSAALYLSRSF